MAQGRDTISQRISIEGALEVIRQLQQMGAAGERAIKQIQDAVESSTGTTSRVGAITDNVRAHFEQFHHQLEPVREKLHEVREASDRLGESLHNTAGSIIPHFHEVAAIAFAGSVVGVVALVKETANYTQELKKVSDEVGLTKQQYQELNFVMRAAGLEQERVISTMTRLARSVGEAVIQSRAHINDLAKDLEGDTLVNNVVLRGGRGVEDAKAAGAELARHVKDGIVGQTPAFEAAIKQLYDATIKRFQETGQSLRGVPPLIKFMQDAKALLNDLTPAGAKFRTELFRFQGVETPIKTVAEAFDRMKEAGQDMDVFFTQLKVRIFDLKGEVRPLFEIFKDVGEKLGGLEEGEKQFKAQLIFNRGFKEVLPLFAEHGHELKELTEEYHKLKVAISDTEIELGSKLFTAFAKMNITLENMKTRLILVFTPEIIDIIDAITEAVQHHSKEIIEWARHLRDDLAPGMTEIVLLLKGQISATQITSQWVKTLIDAFEFLKAIVSTIGGAFRIFISVMDRVADRINAMFGTEWTGKQLAAVLIIGQLVGAFGILFSTIQLGIAIIALVAGTVAAPWVALIAGVTAAGIAVALFWPEVVQAAKSAGTSIKNAFFEALTWLGDFVDAQVFKWTARFSRFAHEVAEALRPIADFFGGLANEGVQAGATLGRSGGGSVPGSGRGDHVPARLEPGEYVVQGSSVRKFGIGFMNMLNQGILPQGFSLGGIVDRLSSVAPQPLRMAGGGGLMASTAGPGRSLTLVIEGQSYGGLTVPSREHDRLLQHARTSSMISTGKKSSWYGER